MNEREKLEKVIKGLEYIRDYDPMFRVAHDDEFSKIAANALALLKAQEPKVMTLEEAKALEQDTVVWYEQHGPDGDYITAMVADGREFIGNASMGVNLRYLDESERLWTSRPTDEQREATPWE